MKKHILSFLTLIVLAFGFSSLFTGSASNSDELIMVWYPNESGNDLKAARDAIGEVVEEVTGKKVDHKLTTDYAVAIETIANGNAQLAFMGAQGYTRQVTRMIRSSRLWFLVAHQAQLMMQFTIAG